MKGFIDLVTSDGTVTVAVSAIAAILNRNLACVITFAHPISGISLNSENGLFVGTPYTEIIKKIEAAQESS